MAVQELKLQVKAALVIPSGADQATLTPDQKYDSVTVSLALKRVESGVMRKLVLKEGYRATVVV